MVRRNILITGASAGLGAGMARRFATMGRNLALCARRGDRLAELRAELRDIHPGIRCETYELDVTDHASVFSVFAEARASLGSLDRVIVNAGRSNGKPLGTGGFDVNADLVATNFTAALAQTEAAMTAFREQGAGHLVMISSFASVRGFPGGLATYSATKAAVAVLAEGLRLETAAVPIAVTAIHPGYIRSEMNARRRSAPFMVDNDRGCRQLVRTIEREPASAFVPAWPWTALAFAMRHLPPPLLTRLQSRLYPPP